MRSRPQDTDSFSGAFGTSPLEEPSFIETFTRTLGFGALASVADATSLDPPDLRQQLTRHVDSSRESANVDLATLWEGLVAGRLRVADHFFDEHSGFLAVRPSRPGPDTRRFLRPQRLRVLERVLLKGGQKSVAAELGLAPSTVAIIAGNCLRAMGIHTGASRAPLPLVIAAHAYFGANRFRHAKLRALSHEGVAYAVVSTERPEQELASLLSRAELCVVRLLVEGKSHAEMSELRHTSTRTIANQLASAFTKLEVSGRSELLCKILQSAGERTAPLPASSPINTVVLPLASAVGH